MQPIHSSALKAELAASIPRLRAFALFLCRTADGADDLVEVTLVKAWAQIGSLVEGADLTTWLITILRNAYFSRHQEQRCKGSDRAGIFVNRLAIAPERNDSMDSLDLPSSLAQLSADQREALTLVCGGVTLMQRQRVSAAALSVRSRAASIAGVVGSPTRFFANPARNWNRRPN